MRKLWSKQNWAAKIRRLRNFATVRIFFFFFKPFFLREILWEAFHRAATGRLRIFATIAKIVVCEISQPEKFSQVAKYLGSFLDLPLQQKFDPNCKNKHKKN